MKGIFSPPYHHLYAFHQTDRWYIADVEGGLVCPVKQVTCDILEWVHQKSTAEIFQVLSARYSLEAIACGFRQLQRLFEIGLLQPRAVPQAETAPSPERPQLFVTSGFIAPHRQTHVLAALSQYQLMTHLAKRAEVHLAYPEGMGLDEHIDGFPSLEAEGFHKVPYPLNLRSYSPASLIPEDCSGILSAGTAGMSELIFHRARPIPIVSLVQSDLLFSQEAINSVMMKMTASRAYDVLCVDGSFVPAFFSPFDGQNDSQWMTIPMGRNLEQIPLGKEEARKKLALITGKPVDERPVMGFIGGFPPQETGKIVETLIRYDPHRIWIVFDPLFQASYLTQPQVIFVSVCTRQDLEALPLIFSALDVLCGAAVAGMPFSILKEALGYGVPAVIASKSPLEELEAAVFHIPWDYDLLNRPPYPCSQVLQAIDSLLKEEIYRIELGQKAQSVAEKWTWEQAVEKLLEILHLLNGKKSRFQENQGRRFPTLFSHYHNKAQQRLELRAASLKGNFPLPIGEALIETLSPHHSTAELEILKAFIEAESKADDKGTFKA